MRNKKKKKNWFSDFLGKSTRHLFPPSAPPTLFQDVSSFPFGIVVGQWKNQVTLVYVLDNMYKVSTRQIELDLTWPDQVSCLFYESYGQSFTACSFHTYEN
jgi:hypothetical protein